MQSIYDFLVEPKKERYNNKTESGIILNTQLDNHNFVSRNAIIKSLPLKGDTEISVGDEVIVHHNVFRRFHDIRGKEVNSKSYFDDGQYIVNESQIFLYKKRGKWIGNTGYCFVKPLKSIDKFDTEKERPLIGILKYLDKDLSNIGLKEEDLVGFTPHSEYEFIIEGERLYRVPTNSISIKYEYQGDEEEYNPSWGKSS